MADSDVPETLEELSRALQESTARLEEAQRVAHVGHWEWDLGTNVVVWSDETYRIFGLTPQERPMDLATVQAMVHPDDRESLYRGVDEDLVAGVRPDAEFRIVRPSGEVRTVQSLVSRRWSSTPGDGKRDASGQPHKLFGTVQDITDRKRAEDVLQRTQFYLREGERIAHIGSWAFNESGHYWSEELYSIYGLDPQKGAPTVEQYLDLIHPDDRASIAEAIKRMQEEHRGHDLIERIVRPDGELRYVRAVAIPVIEHGVFKGFVGTTMDVTAHELLTQELRRERAYLTEAQRLAHIGSWACSLVTREVFHASDENARIFGFDPSQVAMSFDRFYGAILAEDEVALSVRLENAIRTETDFDVNYRIHRADGTIRFLRAIGHHDPSQPIGEYVGITMDITERKLAEEEHEKLRQLETDLAHINRLNMMGELAAALAHEIKQPIAASITSANACLKWLDRDAPDLARARAAAVRVEREGNRAADVIDRLWSFYKKGSPPTREVIDVKEIIREMSALFHTEAVRHAIEVRWELHKGGPQVLADRVQLQQVFMNLILNAIEAMKGSGGELRISSRLTPDRHLVVSISDTGVGLPSENVGRIFDAFYTTKPQGTGMGLAITRSIVEAHGGRVWATANPRAGTTFHFTLPATSEGQA